MTTPHEVDQGQEYLAPSPVLVGGTIHIGHALDTQSQGADFGTYVTFTTPAGADVARPILPYDSNRHKAYLTVSYVTTPIPVAPFATPGVWIGTQAQCQASPPVGGFIPVGAMSYPIEHNAAVWLIGDGVNALRVTVAMERWA